MIDPKIKVIRVRAWSILVTKEELYQSVVLHNNEINDWSWDSIHKSFDYCKNIYFLLRIIHFVLLIIPRFSILSPKKINMMWDTLYVGFPNIIAELRENYAELRIIVLLFRGIVWIARKLQGPQLRASKILLRWKPYLYV